MYMNISCTNTSLKNISLKDNFDVIFLTEIV